MIPNLDIAGDWRAYLEARASGIKSLWKKELAAVLERIDALEGETLASYLESLCELALCRSQPDRNAPQAASEEVRQLELDSPSLALPLAHPGLLPKLQAFWLARFDEPRVKLWLYCAYGLQDTYIKMRPLLGAAEGIDNPSPEILLQQILADSGVADFLRQQAALHLARSLLDSLDFALHEVPYCLCIRADICWQMLDELDELATILPVVPLSRFNLSGEAYRRALTLWCNYCDYTEEQGARGHEPLEYDDWCAKLAEEHD